MPYKDGFFVPTTDLESDLMHFSIFSNSLSAKNKQTEALLQLTRQAFPHAMLRHLVCLLPERLVEHEIFAHLQTNIELDLEVDDEINTLGNAFTLVQRKLSPAIMANLCFETRIMSERLEQEIKNFFDHCENHTTPYIQSLLSTEQRTMLNSMYQSKFIEEPWKSNPSLLKAVCIQQAMAIIYTEKAREKIQPHVQHAIRELCAEGLLTSLSYVEKDSAVAIFTTGGVASGKGSSLRHIESVLQKDGIAWKELVHHNADRFKAFLQDPTIDPLRFSQFTYEEALLIKERVMDLIHDYSETSASGCHPHFLHDQTKLKPDELLEANQHYGQILIVAVSTDVETAIERAFHRGEKTHRFEHTEGLLKSHQAVPTEMIKSLNQDDLFGSKMKVFMIDNNHSSENLTIFATIDMAKKKISIYDERMMANWIVKETINPNARNDESLYFPEKTPKNIEEYFLPLLKKGFNLEFSLMQLSKQLAK